MSCSTFSPPNCHSFPSQCLKASKISNDRLRLRTALDLFTNFPFCFVRSDSYWQANNYQHLSNSLLLSFLLADRKTRCGWWSSEIGVMPSNKQHRKYAARDPAKVHHGSIKAWYPRGDEKRFPLSIQWRSKSVLNLASSFHFNSSSSFSLLHLCILLFIYCTYFIRTLPWFAYKNELNVRAIKQR